MQTLRRKNSPCKFKNEPTRFLGDGVSFKAKLIGILEVSEARGDRMCQAALADLKMAIRAAGEHKQRIAVQVNIDGLRLRDEKSGDCLYHHPVHKISFIAQDMSDSRAFGYIFGSPDTGHRFFGIKTDKAASQVVIAMRDLFQVVFELKKKEIELAKQLIDPNTINSIKFQSGRIFGESSPDAKLKETVRPILPPPPSSSKRGHLERQQTIPAPSTSTSSSPALTVTNKSPPPQGSVHWFDKETENLFNDGELTSIAANDKKDQDDNSLSTTPRNSQSKSPQIDVFTELDPLGTGLIKPYIDKKDFFQHLKNPPKKVLKDLVTTNSTETFPTNFSITVDSVESSSRSRNDSVMSRDSDGFEDGNFANFEQFEDEATTSTPRARAESPRKREPSSSSVRGTHHQPLSVNLPPEDSPITKTTYTSVVSSSTVTKTINRQEKDSDTMVKLPSPKKYLSSTRKRDFDIELSSSRGQSMEKSFPVDFTTTTESPASPLRSCSSDANSRLSSSSAELELVPEPPPRGAGSILINPPPLPPKKQQGGRGGMKPPPRPPHTEGHFHYDFLEREEASPSPTKTKERSKSPLRESKGQFDDNFSPPPQLPGRSDVIGTMTASTFEDSFSSILPTTTLSSLFTCTSSTTESRRTKPSLDIIMSQLTSSNLAELATSLNMTISELTSLTLHQLTECLASLAAKESANLSTEPESTNVAPPVMESPDTPKLESVHKVVETSFVVTETSFQASFEVEPQQLQEATYDKYAALRELLEMEQTQEEFKDESMNEEDATGMKRSESEELDKQEEGRSEPESLSSLVNLTVKLPPTEDSLKEEPESLYEDAKDTFSSPIRDVEQKTDNTYNERDEIETTAESSLKFVQNEMEFDSEEKITNVAMVDAEEKPQEKHNDINSDRVGVLVRTDVEETNDRYAALRKIIGEPEVPKMEEEHVVLSRQSSPNIQPSSTSKSLAEAELLNLFSDVLPAPASPKQKSRSKEEDLKAVAMDIFEEIKMLNTDLAKSTKPVSGFEDMFCPFVETKPEVESKDENWAKFDTCQFGGHKDSSRGGGSLGGTSPWSPDGKEFHREPMNFKGHRHMRDSDNDEEEAEDNGRLREDSRYCCHHPHFDTAPAAFEERPIYDEIPGDKRDRMYRDRISWKSRGGPRSKPCHRPRGLSPSSPPWHDESLRGPEREETLRRYTQRKPSYKDEEEPYEVHWKCRSMKSQRSCCGGHGHEHAGGSFYDEERKRKIVLWNEEERFGSQESMGYVEDEDRRVRRKYDRRRWEQDDGRFWNRRGPPPPPDPDYPNREVYYYYRDSRERPPYDYPPYEEDYVPEKTIQDDPHRYSGRKRLGPKRPNSANDGRNGSDIVYDEPRYRCGTSRSECSDDLDPYLRSSQRSRSREIYWGSDVECDSWVDRSYWSEGPDVKSEALKRKRVIRHKLRPPPLTKTQSPFEDDFSQSIEHVETPAADTPGEFRLRAALVDQKREGPRPSPPGLPSPSRVQVSPAGSRGSKEGHSRRDGGTREGSKRSSYFEDDLASVPSVSSDTSERQRLPSDLKVTPEEPPTDSKDPYQPIDAFSTEDSNRDSFFNGDLRFDDDDDAFAFKSELQDSVPDSRITNLALKNSRQSKYSGNNNNSKSARSDQYIRKSESVNIFVRKNDPFDDDDFFN
ncbi:protein disabled isoform X2 [Prorops nasuta]|uniref:protein disabled isoform X2 n=1 Tax=Prorops nasuta TaxID=863751 RepID=UPI0034CF7A95